MVMTCDSWLPKLDAYLDGELPAAEMAAFDAHVRSCTSCAANVLARVQMKRSIRDAASRRFVPSAEFRNKIRAQVQGKTQTRRSFSWLWAAVAMALVLATVLSGYFVERRSGQRAIYNEVADLHVATLASANPVDVISTDRHTVKPWFQGKIPFSFNLPEVGNSEFKLLGGRVTYLRSAPGAHLIYQFRKHQISVFIFPEQSLSLKAQQDAFYTHLSFHVTTWTQGGLRYFIVGDVSGAEIQALATLFKSAT